MSLGRVKHIDVSLETVKDAMVYVRNKRKRNAGNGGAGADGPKMNLEMLIEEIEAHLGNSKSDAETSLLNTLKSGNAPTKVQISAVSSDDVIIQSLIKHTSKQFVYLYKGASAIIDTYLDSHLDNYHDIGQY